MAAQTDDLQNALSAGLKVAMTIIIATICFVVIVFWLADAQKAAEETAWQAFLAKEHCRVVEKRKDETAWLCNDGVIYWR